MNDIGSYPLGAYLRHDSSVHSLSTLLPHWLFYHRHGGGCTFVCLGIHGSSHFLDECVYPSHKMHCSIINVHFLEKKEKETATSFHARRINNNH